MYDEPFAGLDPISLGVIGNLIRRLNDALGATSIVVTHDVQESLKMVDYLYFVSDGSVVAEGTAADMQASPAPFVHQFVYGEPDGPVPFHYPSEAYDADLAWHLAMLDTTLNALRLTGRKTVNGVWRIGEAARFLFLTLYIPGRASGAST